MNLPAKSVKKNTFSCRSRGRQPPTRVIFSENVCENERIGSRGGVRRAHHLDPLIQCNFMLHSKDKVFEKISALI